MLWGSTNGFKKFANLFPSLWCWVCCAVSGTISEARIQFLPVRLCVSALTQRQTYKELNTQLREFLGTLHALEILSPHTALLCFTECTSPKCAEEQPTEAALVPMPRPWDSQPAAWTHSLCYHQIWGPQLSRYFMVQCDKWLMYNQK